MPTCTEDLIQAARKAAGNWRRFDCFVWYREDDITDPDNPVKVQLASPTRFAQAMEGQAEAIVAMNRVRHPGFVRGGKALDIVAAEVRNG